MQIFSTFSPNFNKKKRPFSKIKHIIIHYTGMHSERESLKRLTSFKSKVSSHYFICRKGKIHNLVDETKVAWHAGKSSWGNYKNLNNSSIGIELVNKGHDWGYQNFTKKQKLSLIKLCKKIIIKYRIKKNDIVGHSDIAPDRKKDPGEKFPWSQLAKNNIGIWHSLKERELKRFRRKKIKFKKDKIKFIKDLKKIGYNINLNSTNSHFKLVLKAFQRHYRNELINDTLDQECLIISENLRKMLKTA
ncbi:MAG: N-acetylmuramoyl-L-alanine amidase [Candidatus Pelagibacter sp. TMED64]|nr:N-acetylmuramoyl-L-alanine amidase [Candidatus Pelagibacter sp.]OUU65887.1 MAG: N-acetylmuramoyl-L-alanine amidase [Candidatus Pelagibacter sp. TMED64]|tara:strand:+ start:6721 stop:7458 length:738 start_codon:yes stop_codon:yes gene_type:complete